MYKVLIVDDEMIVRHAVKTLIQWDGSQFEYAGSASNGTSALKMIRQQPSDIVITDIKMPEMDGIELIKELVSSGFDGEILVLSNFNDFELVREALKYGAHDYILKLTLKSDHFMQTLEEVAHKLDEKKRGPGTLRVVPQSGMKGSIGDSLLSVYNTPEGKDVFGSGDEWEKVMAEHQQVYTFIVQMDSRSGKRESGHFEQTLENLWSDVYPGSSWHCAMNIDGQRLLLAASYPENAISADPAEMAERISSLAALYYSMNIAVIYGQQSTTTEELRSEIRMLKEAQVLLFYRQNEKSCMSSNRRPTNEDADFQHMETSWTANIRRSYVDSISEWERMAIQIIEKAAQILLRPRLLKRAVSSGVWSLSRQLMQEGQRVFDESVWLERITAADSDVELCSIVKELAQEMMEKAEGDAGIYASRSEVRKALAYLEEHYAQSVTIHDISLHVNLSETYLCQIFKAETGKSIMTYLNELRMTKAYEMLASGRYLVKEVAAEVGIHDPFYFNRLFKRQYGVSPRQVKQQ